MATRLTREAVLAAIAEFDRLTRQTFLKRYGFKGARDYFLVHEGSNYDSKAIVAAAHQYLPGGRALRYNELSGGIADAAGQLVELGFQVTSPGENADWSWDEHVLALDLYMVDPTSPPAKGSKPIAELSALLNLLGERSGLARTSKFRNANGVYMKLMNFRRVDPAFRAQGKSGLSRGAKLEQQVWDAYEGNLGKLRSDAAAIRLAIADTSVSLVPSHDDYEAEEGAILLKLHRSRERDRKLIERKKGDTLAKLGRLTCEVCEFDFGQRYGALGIGFIEAHHRKPVSSLTKGEKTRLSDLALVCSNCHRMLHKGKEPLSVEGLRSLVAQG